jgi:hypothetical protein
MVEKGDGFWRRGHLEEAVVATTGGAVSPANRGLERFVEKRYKSRVLL